jgi:quinol monooxygenase YgiN
VNTFGVGFAVVYRWRLRRGQEASFQRAWEATTRGIMKERGGLGSRLHRAEDGTWVAYAQWPDKQAWTDSRALGTLDPAAAAVMDEAIEESLAPILLSPVSDLLVST